MLTDHATPSDKRCQRPPPSETQDTSVFTVRTFDAARQILRSSGVRQAGFNAELLERFVNRAHAPVLYQEGEPHQKQRSATARFFAPRVVATRYRDLIERTSQDLVQQFRAAGRARLDDMSLELALAVAADIVGLTNSSRANMAARLNRFFSTPPGRRGAFAALGHLALGQFRLLGFYLRDVRPAIRARRNAPREDVISHLIAEGYSNREILTECLTYAAAGMATTREFIVMAALRLFERDDLRERFLASDEQGRMIILEEILRLEPVVSTLKRRTTHEVALATETGPVTIPAETLIEIDVGAANRDSAAAGQCPHALDPDRQRAAKIPASLMGFGDGPHRCPGASVALHEAAIFLDHLLRIPALRLEQTPVVSINPVSTGYELRNAVIATVSAC